MKRLSVLLVVVLSLTGCTRRAPYTPDPFFGPILLPPPGTGTANADPCYSPPLTPVRSGAATQPPAANNSAAPPWSPPGDSASAGSASGSSSSRSGAGPAWPPATDRSTPAETSLFGRQASSESRYSSTRLTPPDYPRKSTSSSPPSTALVAVGNRTWSDPVTIGSDAPATRPGAASSAAAPAGSPGARVSVSPRLMPDQPTSTPLRPAASPAMPARGIDIMDLPDVPTTDSGRPGATAGSDPVGIASSSGDQIRTASFSPPAQYGHDPEYAWLKGKLEYSDVDKRWKLRYIPIDGKADRYGGSVVLSGYGASGRFQPGDFAEVHGQMMAGASAEWGYAPVFEAARLTPL